MKMNISTVFGLAKSLVKAHQKAGVTYVSLSHAGVHPRIRKDGPSACKDSRRTFMTPCSGVSNHVLAMSFKPY
jgi:hypothetical protein